jgi:type II secretory pathway pseudopilin PulG
MLRPSNHNAFTLIEMITVIAIIIVLVSLVLAVNSLVQSKSARSRADAEIRLLGQACEAYKTDFGGYPQDSNPSGSSTDTLDPTVSTSPNSYVTACDFLYEQLSGDANGNGTFEAGEKPTAYLQDFFRPSRLNAPSGPSNSTYITDPWGNSYGYSTAGLRAQQDWQAALALDPSKTMKVNGSGNPVNSLGYAGYNTTFDLWSTGGSAVTSGTSTVKWVKNW